MPKIIPLTMEEIEAKGAEMYPLPLRNGLIHLHYVRTGRYRYEWVAKSNSWQGMCGTRRCVKLEIKHGKFQVPCKHDLEPVEWGTMKCVKCNEHVTVELAEIVQNRSAETDLGEETKHFA